MFSEISIFTVKAFHNTSVGTLTLSASDQKQRKTPQTHNSYMRAVTDRTSPWKQWRHMGSWKLHKLKSPSLWQRWCADRKQRCYSGVRCSKDDLWHSSREGKATFCLSNRQTGGEAGRKRERDVPIILLQACSILSVMQMAFVATLNKWLLFLKLG